MSVFWATIGVARAEDFCTSIDDLIEQSRSQFVDITGLPKDQSGDHDATLTLAGASYCAVTKRSKRSLYHCGWEFPHRAEQAYETFDAFVEAAHDCIGPQATVHSDQGVNHPDFYDARRFEMKEAEVSVSVKDKGALGRTFVFIRVRSKARK